MNGFLSLKMDSDDRHIFLRLMEQNDILFLQETFLGPDEHRSLNVPPGYTVVSKPRPWSPNYRIPGGGVLAVVKTNIKFRVLDDISAPDLLVIDIGDMILVSAYILPENSPHWTQWSESHPSEKVARALFHCYSVEDKPIVLLGDLNARTRSEQRSGVGPALRRYSPDGRLSSRGRWLIRMLESYSLCLLNGTSYENKPGSCALTSLQKGRGNSVVDYLAMSSSLIDRCSSMVVYQPHREADHCCIAFLLKVHCQPIAQQAPAATTMPRFAMEDKIDVLLRNLLQKPQLSFTQALSRLYGPVCVRGNPTEVRLACAVDVPSNAAACCCMWNVSQHKSIRMESKSVLSVALEGLVLALIHARPNKPLVVFTSVVDLIQLLCYDIVRIANSGWKSRHRLVLQRITRLISRRRAPVQLSLVLEDHSSPAFNVASYTAHQVLRSSTPNHIVVADSEVDDVLQSWDNAPAPFGPPCPPDSTLKLFSMVPQRVRRIIAHHSAIDTSSKDVDPGSAGHRGRARVRRLMTLKLNLLLNCSDPARWWRIIKSLDCVRHTDLAIPLEVLAQNFELRMNPPTVLPPQFDRHAYAADQLFNTLLPPITEDVTPDLDFTRPFTVREIDDAKRHISGRSMHTASGIDGISYRQVLSISSDDLATLFNTCVAERSCPKQWLMTMLVGIQKKGKPADDPNSYRIIALECCLLKFLTLLCITRLRAWIAAIGLLPDSQNGFRPGMRTENCPFVLRTAIDKTRATNDVLYVAFMDLTNAFPSTNRPTLWRVLYDHDARGPIIDWLRMLYDRMEYVVTGGMHHEQFSPQFKSFWGILAGDSGSPDFFNIYMASFLPPILSCHVTLGERPVCNVEQADDICLWTRTAMGLQILVHYCVLIWCALSFLIANAVKSNYMIFGSLPTHLTPIRSGDDDLALVSSFTYVGITFQSTKRDIFTLHYRKKEASARHVTMMIFKKEGVFGTLDPTSLMRMYTSQIDPHLTYGCQVVIDVSPALLRGLEQRQLSFLRRALGLHRHTSPSLLYFLTGVTPIKFRRLVLQLRFLNYLLSSNDNQTVACAFDENKRLLADGSSCWIGDLFITLRRVLPSHPVPVLADIDSQWVNATCARVSAAAHAEVNSGVLHNATVPLLHRPQLPLERPLRLLPFLSKVHIPAHRRALILLLTGCHKLFVVVGRHQGIPRSNRLCRRCSLQTVEDELHVIFCCPSNPQFVLWRAEFFDRISPSWPSWNDDLTRLGPTRFVQRIIFGSDRLILESFARLCCRVYYTFVNDLSD